MAANTDKIVLYTATRRGSDVALMEVPPGPCDNASVWLASAERIGVTRGARSFVRVNPDRGAQHLDRSRASECVLERGADEVAV